MYLVGKIIYRERQIYQNLLNFQKLQIQAEKLKKQAFIDRNLPFGQNFVKK
jgi:hypothetical protein